MGVQIGASKVAGLYAGGTPIQGLYGGHGLVWPPQGSAPSAPTTTQQLEGPLMFDADYASKGLGAYKNVHPIGQLEQGIDVGTCLDPIDQSRTVMFSDNRRGFHTGNGHPRAQVEGPFFVKPKKWDNTDSRYAIYSEVLFPKDFPIRSTADWTSVGGSVHGAPWTTGSALGLMLTWDKTSAKPILRMHDTPEWLGSTAAFPLGQWVGILRYFRYEHAVDGGFAELWLNTVGRATGWKQVPIMGQDRYNTDIISDLEGNGWWKDPSVAPASPRIGLYGNAQGICYVAAHRIGRAPKDVLPAGWDGLVSGKTFTEAPA